MSLIAGLILFVVGLHKSLYQPTFPALPVVRSVEMTIPNVLTLPVKKLSGTQVPPIQAGAFLVIDQESGEVLAENHADVPLPPASTTKIMTAIVALETMDPERIVTVPENIDGVGSKMNLVPGEQIRIKDLIVGLLVHSSNDAAQMLAYSYEGGETGFVEEMNRKSRELSMDHTHYQNPSGLNDPEHLTTVRDLLILARYAMKNPMFSATVKLKEIQVASVDGKISHKIETTNKLLGEVEGIEGIKTGWTEEAGECLVTQVSRQGHTILTALLRSPDRFAETRQLISWVYSGYYWESKPLGEWK